MSSNQSHQSDPKSHASVDTASMLSTSTTNSMTALLKSKFTPKHKSKLPKPDDHLSPGEKQAKRNEGRISPETLATWAAMRKKVGKVFDDPSDEAAAKDPVAARRSTAFLRSGSL